MITTDDGELAERVRLLREHGMKVRYHHDVVGYNFRMTDIAAAIGLAQLPKLPANNERRRAIAARYDAELRGVITPQVRPGVTHVYHQYTLRVNERDAFAEALKARGVGSAIYYPIPVHRQKPFLALGYGHESLPVTDQLTRPGAEHPGPSVAQRRRGDDGHRRRQRDGRAARPAGGGSGRSMSDAEQPAAARRRRRPRHDGPQPRARLGRVGRRRRAGRGCRSGSAPRSSARRLGPPRARLRGSRADVRRGASSISSASSRRPASTCRSRLPRCAPAPTSWSRSRSRQRARRRPP